jgi:hypothetical protein
VNIIQFGHSFEWSVDEQLSITNSTIDLEGIGTLVAECPSSAYTLTTHYYTRHPENLELKQSAEDGYLDLPSNMQAISGLALLIQNL